MGIVTLFRIRVSRKILNGLNNQIKAIENFLEALHRAASGFGVAAHDSYATIGPTAPVFATQPLN